MPTDAGPGFDRSLPPAEWQARRAAHRQRVAAWADDRVRRAGGGEKHPVHDFLFEYYSFRPGHWLRWSPGVGVRLEDAADTDWPAVAVRCDGGAVVPAAAFPDHRRTYLQWAIRYLDATGRRDPVFGCFGLHEWAMVYRDPATRHRVPLRLSAADTDAVVDAGPVRCTHYDAFRFFTPAAVPLNRFPLTRETSPEHDQPGCVHVTMDLYKFAYKLAPFTSAEVTADAFALALAARELDMRASPYDLSGYGFAAIRIETRDGREEYAAGQRELYRRAQPIRDRLLAEYRRLEA
ncbi:MAG: 3-methyladenine DNA glycosylase [Fimbriiglobus sp.]